MKKMFVLLLCVVMMACTFASAMENPWVEMPMEEAFVQSGIELNVPEDAENASFSYNKDIGMLQMVFTIDGMEYTARAASTGETATVEDISGMNYEWDNTIEEEVNGLKFVLCAAKDGDNDVQICNWLDVVPGIVYSVSTIQPDTDGLDLQAIALQVYAPMQGEA